MFNLELRYTYIRDIVEAVISLTEKREYVFLEFMENRRLTWASAIKNYGIITFKSTDNLIDDVCSIIDGAQRVAYQSVNTVLVLRNWMVGKDVD